MTMQLIKNDISIGEFATIKGYRATINYVDSDKDAGNEIKEFFNDGKTDVPDIVANQARICASGAPQDVRSCLMEIYKTLRNKSGTIIISSS